MYAFLITLIVIFFDGIDCYSKCRKKLVDVKIVPTYADFGTSGNLKVHYGSKNDVQCGNELSLLATPNAPTVTYDAKGKCSMMSIIMFDPDVPIPTKNIFLHWFVANIPKEVMKNGYNKQTGHEIASYFPPVAATGNHRYTFCVYCQKRCIRKQPNFNLFKRIGIHPRNLAAQYGLKKPEACNFFYLTAVKVPALQTLPIVDTLMSLNKNLGNLDKTRILK